MKKLNTCRRSLQFGMVILCLLLWFSCLPKKVIFSTSAPRCLYGKPYKISNQWYYPMTYVEFFEQKGIASWYGKQFHGRKTSNGEVYNMYDVSAAHKTLPLGTIVRVYNLENKKSLVVRINDRGPFIRGRIIDLSYGAARRLGIVNQGTARVYLKTISIPPPPKRIQTVLAEISNGSCFQIQVGAFGNRLNAESLCNRLKPLYNDSHILQTKDGTKTFYRVMIGNCMPQQKAVYVEQQLDRHGFQDAFIVAQN
ncbi:MAG: septal ring lytic transglycosylase RlpA family protein [Candidatus Magnetomorum sp.]|nr:septal ring lytic transglycosylase RlpA family protein [Candidatus Magnetomorum sp.]